MAYSVGEQAALIVVGIFAEQQTLLTLLLAAGLVDVARERCAVEVDGAQRTALGVVIVEFAVVRQAQAFELTTSVVGVAQGAPALVLGDQAILTVILKGQRMILAVIDADQPAEAIVVVADFDPVGQGFDEQAPGAVALVASNQTGAEITRLGLFQQMAIQVINIRGAPPVKPGFLSDQSGGRVIQTVFFARFVFDLGQQ